MEDDPLTQVKPFVRLDYARFGNAGACLVYSGYIADDSKLYTRIRYLLGTAKELLDIGANYSIVIDRIEECPEEIEEGCVDLSLVIEDLRYRYSYFG